MIHIDIDYKSLNKNGEELCGDKVEIFRAPDADILVLSDGLGSGVKANILATLTTKIIITMLKEGSSVDEAVETIARTLPVCKVRQLAYSTFSILRIAHDGSAYLAEFDSPACVFVRGGKATEIPYEIREIAGKNVRESHFDVAVGDTFCLFSDGVIHAGVGALLNFGWQWENVANYVEDSVKHSMSVPRTVASLAQVVDSLYTGKPGDDSTILLARAIPQKPVSIITGPPENPENDQTIVHDFMRAPGGKIVCGGSTANMVSRILNRPLEASLSSSDPRVPPTAVMKGMDLVTEGVLTMSRAIELLEACRDAGATQSAASFTELDADNGAAKLAHFLLEQCTHVTFFVGKAINPAHQNPSLPVDLSIKLRLVEHLCETLRSIGKVVEVRYY